MSAKVLVLAGFGINCEQETAGAFSLAGGFPQIIHLNDLLAEPERLHESDIFAIPGGFSFGDDIASGRILANRLRFRLGAPLRSFVEQGKLVIGICNGFQVLVKMGLLPMVHRMFAQEATLTHNDSHRYEDRWVWLAADPQSPCIWTRGMTCFELPVRHGEGKFVPRDAEILDALHAHHQIALRYTLPDGSPARGRFPYNPNGSVDDIAGICDRTGRVFGLMPHPEAYALPHHHPCWTRQVLAQDPNGLCLFRNAVAYVQQQRQSA